MKNEDIVRLRHMLDAAREVVGFFQGQDKSDLCANRMLLMATVKELEIIGEADAKVSRETADRLPTLPWPDIIGMRHRLVHAYFDIDTEVVWQTVTHDLPPLIDELAHILEALPE